jgi:hypothetical protein
MKLRGCARLEVGFCLYVDAGKVLKSLCMVLCLPVCIYTKDTTLQHRLALSHMICSLAVMMVTHCHMTAAVPALTGALQAASDGRCVPLPWPVPGGHACHGRSMWCG